MSLEKRLIDGDVLERDETAISIDFDNSVDQKKR
jgi:hypothetical protein